MNIAGVRMVSGVNPYVGKTRVRSSVDEYKQAEKQVETFSFVNVLDAEINRQNNAKKVFTDITIKKKRKVEKI